MISIKTKTNGEFYFKGDLCAVRIYANYIEGTDAVTRQKLYNGEFRILFYPSYGEVITFYLDRTITNKESNEELDSIINSVTSEFNCSEVLNISKFETLYYKKGNITGLINQSGLSYWLLLSSGEKVSVYKKDCSLEYIRRKFELDAI